MSENTVAHDRSLINVRVDYLLMINLVMVKHGCFNLVLRELRTSSRGVHW